MLACPGLRADIKMYSYSLWFISYRFTKVNYLKTLLYFYLIIISLHFSTLLLLMLLHVKGCRCTCSLSPLNVPQSSTHTHTQKQTCTCLLLSWIPSETSVLCGRHHVPQVDVGTRYAREFHHVALFIFTSTSLLLHVLPNHSPLLFPSSTQRRTTGGGLQEAQKDKAFAWKDGFSKKLPTPQGFTWRTKSFAETWQTCFLVVFK